MQGWTLLFFSFFWHSGFFIFYFFNCWYDSIFFFISSIYYVKFYFFIALKFFSYFYNFQIILKNLNLCYFTFSNSYFLFFCLTFLFSLFDVAYIYDMTNQIHWHNFIGYDMFCCGSGPKELFALERMRTCWWPPTLRRARIYSCC